AYLGRWAGLEGCRQQALDRALLSGRAVRGLLMRGTVHTVAARDFASFGAALAGDSPGWVTPELEAIAERVAEPLRDFCSAPRTRAEVLDWLEQEHGVPNDGSNGIWYAIPLSARTA